MCTLYEGWGGERGGRKLTHGGPALSQACPRCCGHREPGKGWVSPLGAHRCPAVPPARPPLFPKAPRTRTPWASPVRGGSPWPTMLRTCSAQVSENLSGGWSFTAPPGILPPAIKAESTFFSWRASLPSKGSLAFLSTLCQTHGLSQPNIPAGKKALMGAAGLGDCRVGHLHFLPSSRMG